MSIFKLPKLERDFYFHKFIKELPHYDIFIFHSPKSQNQILNLMRRIAPYKSNKLLIFLFNDKVFIPKLGKSKVRRVRCFDYDRKEFLRYLEKKSNMFDGFNAKKLTQMLGNDLNIIQNIFDSKKHKLSLQDISDEIGKYNIDLQLQTLDKCHIMFLKNLVIEYYKLNHKTDKIPLKNLVHENYPCGQIFDLNKVIRNLKKNKIITVFKNRVRFYSVVVKNSLMRYFRSYKE